MKSPFELQNINGIIRGVLTEPENTPLGCIICLHGGPGGDYHGNTEIFDQLATLAADLGFCIVQYSVYGAPPSDGLPQNISLRTQSIDYASVLTFARTKFPGPFHIVGESAGATVALHSWQTLARSHVLLWPAFDLKNTDIRPFITEQNWQSACRNGYIEENGVIIGKEFFIELALRDFSSLFSVPADSENNAQDVIIIHGKCDKEVPIAQSMFAIESSRRPLSFYFHPTADHGFKRPEEREYVLSILRAWLLDSTK